VTFLLQFLAGISLDRLLGEARYFHPLVGFGWLANWLDSAFPEQSHWRNKITGIIAVFFLVGPITVLVWVMINLPVTGLILSIIFFYLCLGAKSLIDHADRVYQFLQAEDLISAQKAVAMMVSRDTSSMDSTQVSLACIESILENGNDAVFGTIFWFFFLGAPGAVCYRLVNILDAMWGYRTSQYLHFGWAAARLDDLFNWVPARLCALTYALLGKTSLALNCWRQQISDWESPNAGPVMAAGAGALNIQLGGEGMYHGKKKFRPTLGVGRAPVADDIQRAIKLVQSGVIVWILVIVIGVLIKHSVYLL
jgi:adenosylcobinamide-phosphate synthase